MIRDATEADIPSILVMGKAFFDQAPWPRFAQWHEASVTRTLRGLIGNSIDGALLAAEIDGRVVGMGACLVFPLYFNFNILAAQEIFFWIDPPYRNGIGAQLLAALEDRAKAKGATLKFADATEGVRPEAVAKLYARRGYEPIARSFLKGL